MTMTEARRPASTPKELITPERSHRIAQIFTSYFSNYKEHNPTILGLKVREKSAAIKDRSLNPRPHPGIVNTAIKMAEEAHSIKGEDENKDYSKRKFSTDPYIVHPLRVALLSIEIAQAMGIPVTTELVTGALLHDVPENNHGYSGERIAREFQKFESDMPGISRRIADDAAAFNHYKPGREERLDSQAYTDKINTTDDLQILTNRKIIKAADRIDNLLDPMKIQEDTPPTYADKLKESRIEYIKRTKDPKKLIQLLMSDEPFLMELVNMASNLSQMSLVRPDLIGS
jgi:5'-deoxynucleotidase YfbR-like HD superfamily hydrolase